MTMSRMLLLPVEDLDGDLVAGLLVEGNLHLPEGPDPQGLPEDVGADLHLQSKKSPTLDRRVQCQ